MYIVNCADIVHSELFDVIVVVLLSCSIFLYLFNCEKKNMKLLYIIVLFSFFTPGLIQFVLPVVRRRLRHHIFRLLLQHGVTN